MADCVLIARIGFRISIWVVTTCVIQKKDDLMSGTSQSLMAILGKIVVFHFPHVIQVAHSDDTRGDGIACDVFQGLMFFFCQSTHG